MTILIDRPRWWWHDTRWSHLVSDESVSELHRFARTIRLRYLSYQGDHYDVPEGLFERAVDAGAEVADPRELVRRLRLSGLRRRGGKSATSWTQVGERPIEGVSGLLAADRGTVVAELVDRHGPSDRVAVFERPGEQVALCALGDARMRLAGGVEVLTADCAVVESHDPRGHTLEVVWRSGAGRELDHR